MTPVTDATIIERFADALWLERGLSANSLAAYQSDLRHLAAWLTREGRPGLLQAGRDDLLAYLAEVVGGGAKPRTSARRLSTLRQFYQHAARENWRDDDPSARIEAPRTGRPLPGALTEGEVERLLDAPDLDNPEGYRDRAMLEVLYATGLRVSELVGLTADQVNLDHGVVRVIGKGGKERLVPLGEEAIDWLLRYTRGARRELLDGRRCDALFTSRRGRGMTRQAFW